MDRKDGKSNSGEYLLVGGHNAAHKIGTGYPGRNNYWKYISNQLLSVEELVEAGVTIFDFDLYPCDLGVYSSLDMIKNKFLRLVSACFLSCILSCSEKPDNNRLGNDALLAHSVPIL